jgi:uncharacterized protein (DUF362 family)
MEVYFERVDDLEKNVDELLRELSWKKIISRDDRVLIKPNFCTHQLKNGVTTNLDLLRALVDIISKRTPKVFIGETHSGGKNFEKLRERLDVKCDFINLSTVDTYYHKGSIGTYRLPKLALESKIINVPVLKTHSLTGVTLGIKNIFGLIQNKSKSKYHLKIHDVLADLLQVLRPQINILDAIYCNCEGSNDGRILETKFLLASHDAVALDTAACQLIGADPLSVKYIRLLSQPEGAVEILGEGFEDLGLRLQIPKLDKVEKIALHLQGNPLTRRMLELPGVYSAAKRIKKML